MPATAAAAGDDHRRGSVTEQTTRAAAPTQHGPGGLRLGMIKACRPKQWAKNVLVFVAPAAAGVINDPRRSR